MNWVSPQVDFGTWDLRQHFSCMRVKIVTDCRVCFNYMVASSVLGDGTTSALGVWGNTPLLNIADKSESERAV